ncbi:hypothetical protein DIC82_13810 [Clostridium beijerinckii]|nr:hypothetical protein DIC82_13810 [Clostridium beijerinckii]
MNYSLLKKVSYRFNVLVIEFNENMIQENEHSYKEYYNFAFKINDKLIVFPLDVIIKEISYADTLSFTFSDEYSQYLSDNNEVSIGYATLHEIYYVQSNSGYIHPLCNAPKLGQPATELSILNGTAEVMDYKTLKFIYNGDNAFFTVSKDDFYIEINNIKSSPLALVGFNKNGFVLSFPDNTFNNYNGEGYLKVNDVTSTKDIYGYNLKESESLSLGTYISSLSVVNSTINATFLKVVFSLSLKYLFVEDFTIEYNGITEKFDLIFLSDDGNTMYLTLYKPNALLEDINLYTNVNYYEVRTLNYLGNKVYIPNSKITVPFLVNSIIWNTLSDSLNSDSLKSSILSITFNFKPDPSTIITNSKFNETDSPWDGNNLEIPIGSLKFTEESNYDEISIENNTSFGTLRIYSLKDQNFITSTTSNTKPCILTLSGNVLSFSFNIDEGVPAKPLSIELFEYYPTQNIKDLRGKEILTSHIVKGYLYYTHNNEITIFYPPLDEAGENPFTGQTLDNNITLYLADNHNMRTYGSSDSSLVTTINGNMTIISELSDELIDYTYIELQMFNIKGDLYIPSIIYNNLRTNNVNVNGNIYIY